MFTRSTTTSGFLSSTRTNSLNVKTIGEAKSSLWVSNQPFTATTEAYRPLKIPTVSVAKNNKSINFLFIPYCRVGSGRSLPYSKVRFRLFKSPLLVSNKPIDREQYQVSTGGPRSF